MAHRIVALNSYLIAFQSFKFKLRKMSKQQIGDNLQQGQGQAMTVRKDSDDLIWRILSLL